MLESFDFVSTVGFKSFRIFAISLIIAILRYDITCEKLKEIYIKKHVNNFMLNLLSLIVFYLNDKVSMFHIKKVQKRFVCIFRA
jgi:hypothetical protein